MGWVNVENVGSEALPITIYTLCLRVPSGLPSPGVTGRFEVRENILPGTIANQAAGCPNGTRRVGGGGGGSSGFPPDNVNSPIRANYPFAGGWAVTIDNRFVGAEQARLTAFAACATTEALGLLRPLEVARRGIFVGANSRVTALVACPPGAEIVSGGFILPNSGALLLNSSRPSVYGTPAVQREGWMVSVVNRTVQPERFDIVAVCLAIPPP